MTDAPKPNLVTVFEHYGLRILGPDRGGWRKAECPKPSHEDSNPSASINEDTCRWFCHACNEGGDALDVIKEQAGVTRFADLVAIATDLDAGSGGTVRGGSGPGDSLLPRRSGTRQGRSGFVPPWSRI